MCKHREEEKNELWMNKYRQWLSFAVPFLLCSYSIETRPYRAQKPRQFRINTNQIDNIYFAGKNTLFIHNFEVNTIWFVNEGVERNKKSYNESIILYAMWRHIKARPVQREKPKRNNCHQCKWFTWSEAAKKTDMQHVANRRHHYSSFQEIHFQVIVSKTCVHTAWAVFVLMLRKCRRTCEPEHEQDQLIN